MKERIIKVIVSLNLASNILLGSIMPSYAAEYNETALLEEIKNDLSILKLNKIYL